MNYDNLELSIFFAQKACESRQMLDNYKIDYQRYINKEIKWDDFLCKIFCYTSKARSTRQYKND